MKRRNPPESIKDDTDDNQPSGSSKLGKWPKKAWQCRRLHNGRSQVSSEKRVSTRTPSTTGKILWTCSTCGFTYFIIIPKDSSSHQFSWGKKVAEPGWRQFQRLFLNEKTRLMASGLNSKGRNPCQCIDDNPDDNEPSGSSKPGMWPTKNPKKTLRCRRPHS